MMISLFEQSANLVSVLGPTHQILKLDQNCPLDRLSTLPRGKSGLMMVIPDYTFKQQFYLIYKLKIYRRELRPPSLASNPHWLTFLSNFTLLTLKISQCAHLGTLP